MQRDPALDHAGRRTDQPDISHELAALTDGVVAARVVTKLKREGKLSLLGKMKALTESAEDFNKSTAEVLDGIALKIATAKEKRDTAAEKHHGYYDGIIKGVDDPGVVIDRLSNGPLTENVHGLTKRLRHTIDPR